jgi:hypothetical protein
MKNILVRSRYAVKTAYYFCIAFRNNLIAEFLDWRCENEKRQWTAIGTFGAGMIPLGKVTLHEATEKVAKFATVISCDVGMAIIFYKERD